MGTEGEKAAQAVQMHIVDRGDHLVVRLTTHGVPPVDIPMDPQAAFEAGESMARIAHKVRYGHDVQTDRSYLAEQIKARTTEEYRHFLVRRIEVMLNSMREDRKYTNLKLAEILVDTVVTKFA